MFGLGRICVVRRFHEIKKRIVLCLLAYDVGKLDFFLTIGFGTRLIGPRMDRYVLELGRSSSKVRGTGYFARTVLVIGTFALSAGQFCPFVSMGWGMERLYVNREPRILLISICCTG